MCAASMQPSSPGHNGKEVLAIDLGSATDDPFQAWCLDAVWSVIARVQDFLGLNRNGCVLVVSVTVGASLRADEQRASEATIEALRGIVQSITAEIDPARLWCGIVVASESRPDDRDRVLEYLSSRDARFGAGATIDVR
jgi:hypothetical protein